MPLPEPPTLAEAKSELRRLALARRDALSVSARAAASRAIVAHALGLAPLARAATVSGYWPIRSEADIRPMMSALAKRGAALALPVVIDRTRIVFRAWSVGETLADAGFGTKGPPADAPVVEPEAMIVPLAAFDRSGGRIGYGAGHYDRAIAALAAEARRPLLVGVGFAAQEAEAVPSGEHDQRLDWIVTEAGVIACADGAR